MEKKFANRKPRALHSKDLGFLLEEMEFKQFSLMVSCRQDYGSSMAGMPGLHFILAIWRLCQEDFV